MLVARRTFQPLPSTSLISSRLHTPAALRGAPETAHRNPRRRTRTPASANLTTRYTEAPAHMVANPNSGKRHAASFDYNARTAEQVDRERKSYVPLTVSTPIKRARIEPRTTSYTI